MGILYIVATPIGNLKDISLRAMQVLRNVDTILCEDTRRTGILLTSLGEMGRPNLLSYYEQNEEQRIPGVLNILRNGLDVALVTDAGTPSISDPGFRLVRACIEENLPVTAIPGPSSVLTALVVSGLPTDKFLFLGYPPAKPGHRTSLFAAVKQMLTLKERIHPTVIFFAAPHKLLRTLEELQDEFGDIEIVLCRELTKVHEEIRREKVSESVVHFQEVAPKGEFVVLFNLYVQDDSSRTNRTS